jgi:hypothetical protein
MVVIASTTTATDIGIVMGIATVIATYKCYSVLSFYYIGILAFMAFYELKQHNQQKYK